MKRIVTVVIVVLLIVSCCLAESINSIIPNTSIWGISRKELMKKTNDEYSTLEIGKAKVLKRSGFDVDEKPMEVYYVLIIIHGILQGIHTKDYQKSSIFYQIILILIYLISGLSASNLLTPLLHM